jgi:predicted dehydrogenase
MIQAAQKQNVCLYIAENAVYTPFARTLRDIVQTNKYIGEVTFASVMAGFRGTQYGYPGRRAWLSTPEEGGTGTWMLHGIHTIARLRFILGEVTEVFARQHRASSFSRSDLEGTVSALLTLESGVHVTLIQSPETRLKDGLGGYTICGDRGSIRAWDERYEAFTDEGIVSLDYPLQRLSSYAEEIEAFADSIAGTAFGPTTAESERRSLAVVQAGYESIESGNPVRIHDRFGEL